MLMKEWNQPKTWIAHKGGLQFWRFFLSKFNNHPANIYLFKVKTETLEKGTKHDQS